MKKLLSIIFWVIFLTLLFGLNGVVIWGIHWEFMISTESPNWFPMIMSIISVGLLDATTIILAIEEF